MVEIHPIVVGIPEVAGPGEFEGWRGGALDLRAAWYQRLAILKSPAIVLDMGDLQPVGVQVVSERDDVLEAI